MQITPCLPLLPSRRASPPFGWYSFYRPTEGTRLSRPGWLVTYRNKVPVDSKPDTVTHPSTNRAQRRVTSLIETNDGTTTPRRHLGQLGFPWVHLPHLFQERTSGDKCNSFLWAGCSSGHSTISVKALKETQSTNPNQWPGLILSSSTTVLCVERTSLLLCQLSTWVP